MQDPKTLKFFEETLSKTQSGKINWEPTAHSETFIAAIGGKFTLSLYHLEDQWGHHYSLTLKDDLGRQLLTVAESDDGIPRTDIANLYEVARRQALQVDEKLDTLFGELDKL